MRRLLERALHVAGVIAAGALAAPAAAAADAPRAPGTAPAAAPVPAAPLPGPPAAAKPSRPQPGLIVEPAPRPAAMVRVQDRYATKADLLQLFAGAEYLARGDFYVSPGARLGAAYYFIEPLGAELQISHYWSTLNDEADRIRQSLGAIPDSHAPTWLVLAGARYSIGYGKLMVGGLGGIIHFEPQAFAHVGMHDHDGDLGPSADAGLGLLFFLTPRLFARADVALVFERERRSGQQVSVWGVLPAFSVGGML
jgi:outer membrane beta-barrel protein